MPDVHVDPLHAELTELRFMAGRPSFRSISRAIGCSHTTVAKVFAPGALPSWEILHLVVRQLNGDVDAFRKLWCDAARKQEGVVSGSQKIASAQTWRVVSVFTLAAAAVCAGTLLAVAYPSIRQIRHRRRAASRDVPLMS
ncbi:hypothetical protein [Mycobacteroides salmoniphilum]|uniref:hypothetical protein n=1 Tax=Mycobacteroides salmoniphilum TaxID=404941 RepID=UPI0012FFA1D0|nr:hypothetical protein [Mycobacteroides salmoniphilum]